LIRSSAKESRRTCLQISVPGCECRSGSPTATRPRPRSSRSPGLYAKLDAYALQDLGLDTYAANRALGHADDERDYTAAAQMLTTLGATRVDLLTNNPDKPAQLRDHGIDVRTVLPTKVHVTAGNVRYLEAKVEHTQHTIDLRLAV
jgi:GTP cyclohydrolase II